MKPRPLISGSTARVAFSSTLMRIMSPCRRRSSGSNPMPEVMASRGERGAIGPPARELSRSRSGRCRRARRPVRCVRCLPGRRCRGLHRAAARTTHVLIFEVVRFSAASTISPAGRRAARARELQFAPHHHADQFVDAGVSPNSTVPTVSPSRSTVARSQTRKISSILWET